MQFNDLRYRIFRNSVIISANKNHTVGILNNLNEVKTVFHTLYDDSNVDDAFPRMIYQDLALFLFELDFKNKNNRKIKEIRWKQGYLCFITLKDGRILVGAPRLKEEA